MKEKENRSSGVCKTLKRGVLSSTLLAAIFLAACQQAPAIMQPTAAAIRTAPATSTTTPPQATRTPFPTKTSQPTNTAAPALKAVGPDSFPAGVNPLTGLAVTDPELLEVSPGLVSIANAPLSARPQSGLSYASFVYEMYIGEGATRFLAVFYGELPPEEVCDDAGSCQPTQIGPLRSARLPYETLRELYRGFLVFGSASTRVMPHLEERNIVFGKEDAEDTNTAFILPQEMQIIAADTITRRGSPALPGLRFDPQPPESGQPAQQIWVPYHYTDQVFWEYDTDTESYLRLQGDQAGEQVIPFEDKLTGELLTSENVVVLFAQHRFFTENYFDIDLLYISRLPALIFRDGRMYQAFWTTANQEYERTTGRLRPIRFVDGEGNPFPLKNGHTWVMIVPLYTAYNETVESFVFRELQAGNQPGSANWAVHFYPPATGGWALPTPPS